MTRNKKQQPQNLELRKIQRDRTIVVLAIAATIVVGVYTIGSIDTPRVR